MGVHFGKDAKLYNNSGTYGTPVWDEIAAVREIQVPDGDFEEIEASGRDYPLKLSEPGNFQFSIEGKIRTNESDTDFIALETAALAKSQLDIMILTGGSATNGNRGFRMDFKLHKFFGEDQNIDQILWRPFMLKPCVPTNAPKSVVVSSGAPVFTALAM
jgi:hypothetical protein